MNLFRDSKLEIRNSRRAGFTPYRFSWKSGKGFTIIELLVVVAIIALIAAVAIASFSRARAKSRDARRLANVKTIQNALNLYTTNTRVFPNPTPVGGLCLTGTDPISAILVNSSSISQVPIDPEQICGARSTDPPDSAHPHYQYESTDGFTFTLWFLIETGSVLGTDAYPPNCAAYPCVKYITP